MFQFAMNRVENLPEDRKIFSQDGRVFAAKMNTRMYDMVYFLGEYENYVTKVIGNVVKSEDICFDVGANFGWYTTFLSNLKNVLNKNVKEIHAFEPINYVFANLRENIELAGSPENIYLNNFALTDEFSDTKIYISDKLGSGHSSLARDGSNKVTEKSIKTVPLDSYLSENGIEKIDFIKIDIEGSELKFLKGGKKMFSQEIPPVIVMEMALDTTRPFGYLPDDLLKFIKDQGEYEFYALDEVHSHLVKIQNFQPDECGANVLCMPKNADRKRLQGLKITGS
ncbi:MAG: FkbM family methyltransferase [Pyrinomonadaceae bacterium]